MVTYQVDENGFYGQFGGAYIPEILYKTVEDLKKATSPSWIGRSSSASITPC